jgi:hypothetical protein
MPSRQQNIVDHLATELQHWLWLKLGDKTPSSSEVADFIGKHLDKFGHQLVSEQKTEAAKVPALLKKKPEAQDSKRMRELAGIPHKGNFV